MSTVQPNSLFRILWHTVLMAEGRVIWDQHQEMGLCGWNYPFTFCYT